MCPPGPSELDGVIEGYYKRESGLLLVKVVCNALCGAQAHESLRSVTGTNCSIKVRLLLSYGILQRPF